MIQKRGKMSLNDTPRANRLHIGIFGKRNSGKSSLINALTGHNVALVSEHAGTTTDPVYKSMELHPIGPVVFIDTAGFDDSGELGKLRVSRAKDVIRKTDVALLLFDDGGLDPEKAWLQSLKEADVPVIPIINKSDIMDRAALEQKVRMVFGMTPIMVSEAEKSGLDEVRRAIDHCIPEDFKREKILGDMIGKGETVLLVMPQDIQAPKGRLILPQVQTIRELLDNKCITVCVTADKIAGALEMLREDPALIITDSQCFQLVYDMKPEKSALTSFSVLFAAFKGDIETYTEGAEAVDTLTERSRVLIAEACTHAPLEEDIGREQIPRKLRQRYGSGMRIDVVSGSDFPKDLRKYDLVIQCGSCMFNRKYTMSRIEQARMQGVPVSNYGVVLAKLAGILDKITLPGSGQRV